MKIKPNGGTYMKTKLINYFRKQSNLWYLFGAIGGVIFSIFCLYGVKEQLMPYPEYVKVLYSIILILSATGFGIFVADTLYGIYTTIKRYRKK